MKMSSYMLKISKYNTNSSLKLQRKINLNMIEEYDQEKIRGITFTEFFNMIKKNKG